MWRTYLTINVWLDVSSNRVDVLEFLLTQWAREILRGVDRRVVDEIILSPECVLTLLASILLGLAERATGRAHSFPVLDA